MERKIGTVVYASGKNWWLLRVGPETSLETYFLHRKFILSGKTIDIGSTVSFEVGDSRKENDRPSAKNAHILEPDVQALLGGAK
jgi:hypothetical protein